MATLLAVGADRTSLVAAYASTRELLRATNVEGVVGVLITLVGELGGTATPANVAGADALPIDISFGVGQPLLPVTDDLAARARLSALLPVVLEDARLAVAQSRANAYLAVQSETDPLTGLLNRRAVDRALRRLTSADSVALLDLDWFKQVNDTHGHAAGDDVLRAFSRLLRTYMRIGDPAGRVGGEEFLLVLRGLPAEDACAAVERLRPLWQASRPYPVTFSAGVAAVVSDGEQAVRAADAALYAAKESGRDRTTLATQPAVVHDTPEESA